METTTLAVVVTLPGSATEVYETLTDSGRHGAATGAESDIDAAEGGRFSYFGGAVSGTFEQLREDRLIVQRLRAADWPEGHHALVRQELSGVADGRSTRVKVVESDVPAELLDAVIDGWQAYWDGISEYLRERRLDVVRRFIDQYKNGHHPDAVDEFVPEDCVVHSPLPGLPPGREGLRVNGQMMCGAFPDVHAERDFFVTEGEIVVERADVRATHAGELMGIPPTGCPVTWTELHAYRVVGDRIVEIWSEADLAAVMRQIEAAADGGGEGDGGEDNKQVIRRLYGEVMARGNSDVAEEIFASDYRDHMPIMETPDREGLLKSVEAARRAFPDVEPRIVAEVAEGDWVAIAVEVDGGTHQDTYMGVPATGEPVSWTETHFWRVVDGEIVEHHGNVSLFELHKMIGSHDIDSTLA